MPLCISEPVVAKITNPQHFKPLKVVLTRFNVVIDEFRSRGALKTHEDVSNWTARRTPIFRRVCPSPGAKT
jgi:hypothetical protein